MARKLLGFVLIHPEKEDFVVGSNNNEMMNIVAYVGHPEQAKIFKDFEEIKDFVSYLEDFTFDIAKLFDIGDQYVVEFETTVSTKPI